MKKYIYLAMAAVAALSSCSKDDTIMGETGKQALIFTATMESDDAATRATYNSINKCAEWETTDQININGKTYNAQSAGLTTTFRAATKGEEATGSTYNAYFACAYDGTTATLPAEVSETWSDGKFNMPMYATSEDTNLAFKNLCGVLKITVKNTQIGSVKKIKLNSVYNAISGPFTVVNNAAVLKEPSKIENTLTITYTSAVSTTAQGTVFYVAVPAQTYKELEIELSGDGNKYTKSLTTKGGTNITIERNKIYPIAYEGVSVVTRGSTTRTGGSVDWVQLGSGTKFAVYNVGATGVNVWGNFYAWGETAPRYTSYTRSGNGIGNIAWKSGYTVSGKTGGYNEKKYPSWYANSLDASHDAATQNWGSNWRTPTKDELLSLYNATSWTWNATDFGYYVTKKDVPLKKKADGSYNALLFFPATGFFNNDGHQSGRGAYHSSTLNTSNTNYAYYLWFNEAGIKPQNEGYRYCGFQVRPVVK